MSRQYPPPRPDRNAPPTWQGNTWGVVAAALIVAAVVFLLASIAIHQAVSS